MVGLWRHDGYFCLGAWLVVAGCSVGEGEGQLTLDVSAPSCELDERAFELEPSFFSGEVSDAQLNIRVQRGSDIEGFADGLVIHVGDVGEVFSNRIGLPIEVDSAHTSLLQSVLYLNESCPSGFPDGFRVQPVLMEAVSGHIVFDAVYAPEIEPGATRIAAEMIAVRFEDAERPDLQHATVDGWFSFFYQRGSPAQRFP